jgi:hypothetical protein
MCFVSFPGLTGQAARADDGSRRRCFVLLSTGDLEVKTHSELSHCNASSGCHMQPFHRQATFTTNSVQKTLGSFTFGELVIGHKVTPAAFASIVL